MSVCILQATDESHCDRQNLVASIAAMTEVAAAINEYKRRKDLGKCCLYQKIGISIHCMLQ